MTVKQLQEKAKEIKKVEKRIKLMKDLKKTVQEMNRLNSCFDINEILMNKPLFSDEFYMESEKVIRQLEKSYASLTA